MKTTRHIAYGLLLFLLACTAKKSDTQFSLLDASQTGLHFANNLQPRADFNMFNYMYFYNGAGVGAGDFNNDGLIDLYFAANQQQDRLYLNQGGLRFRDITAAAGIPDDGGWSTGVSVVDINNDGMLDLYICRVAGIEPLKTGNLLLVCERIENGVPVYQDRTREYGLDFNGFSTQAAFFDYDLDGDLDMYLMNHSVHHNGTFGRRERFVGTFHPQSGDRFFVNENGRFVDKTLETGIHSSVIGYGLGLVITDLNEDGWPDIYVGNDFHENDYLYINQRDGRFRDELTQRMQHTSQFSMGVDAGDIDNDGLPEIVSMDMLPSDPEILKRSLGEDEYNLFMMKIGYGYNYQYTRNNLQKNNKGAWFNELGLYAGIAATDWSWAPLWADFDNDGYKDLFVSNGIPRRLNDIDYVNFITNETWQQKIRTAQLDKEDMSVVEQFPQIKLPNAFFRNRGAFNFSTHDFKIFADKISFSNGAVIADLDNDGDLDIVTNNIDDAAFVYRNEQEKKDRSGYFQLDLRGSPQNRQAIGARVLIYSDSSILLFEKYPVRGFQSSMEMPLHCAFGQRTIDSILVIWPDRTYQRLMPDFLNEFSAGFTSESLAKSTAAGKAGTVSELRRIKLEYQEGLPVFDRPVKMEEKPLLMLEDITRQSALAIRHIENNFVEFNREPLIPFMLSTEGPALAIADINADGRDDIFLGSSKTYQPKVLLQTEGGKFVPVGQPALAADSMYEEVDAIWLDINGDGHPDLISASGGNEYYGKDNKLLPRAYLNDGGGKLSLLPEAFPNVLLTAASITATDFTGDGFPDLFIAARATPYDYGVIPRSYLLVNDGKGRFIDRTEELIPDKGQLGLLKYAQWFDLDGDQDMDLLIAAEWDGLYALENKDGRFVRRDLFKGKGWWNFLIPVDINNDGLPDLIAGNQGYNNRLKPTADKPVRMFVNDFDENGKKEQLLTYYIGDKEYLFANKMELEKQLPYLKKKFLFAGDFAKAEISDIIQQNKLDQSAQFVVDNFTSGYLVNKGNWNFEWQSLPWEIQLSPLKTCLPFDVNKDGWMDLIVGGNFYAHSIQMGRNDALPGAVLINEAGKGFRYQPWSTLVQGEIRRIKPLTVNGEPSLLVARNNDSLKLFKILDRKP